MAPLPCFPGREVKIQECFLLIKKFIQPVLLIPLPLRIKVKDVDKARKFLKAYVSSFSRCSQDKEER